MARDLRVIGCNKNNYPDKCYLYGKDYIQNNKVVENATPITRFYKTDVVPFQWKRITLGNGSLSNDTHFVGTIETCDHLEMARVGMYVKDQTGMLFVIQSPLIVDDENKSKAVGTRPAVKYTLTLMGVEN